MQQLCHVTCSLQTSFGNVNYNRAWHVLGRMKWTECMSYWCTLQREMLLERGQMRLAQNSAQHQQHTEEILLGRILGPISDRHRYTYVCWNIK